MINKSIKLATIFICFLLLFACSSKNKELNQVNYEIGFPREENPGLMDFFRYYLTLNDGIFLMKQNNEYIYAEINDNSKSKSIQYFSISGEQLSENIMPLFQSQEFKTNFRELTVGDGKDVIKKEIMVGNYNLLPEVILGENNHLTVKTSIGEKVFNLPELLEEFGLTSTDELIINGYSINRDEFAITVRNIELDNQNEFLRLFLKQDLSDLYATSSFEEQFKQSVEKGKLNKYESLVFKKESNGRFRVLNDNYGVLDTNNNKIYSVSGSDLQSKDDNFVYLNGNEKISDGLQRIQKIEDYLEGNDQYYAEFEISLEQISRELDLGSTGNVSTGKIVYFNEDYIVLFLNFTSPFVGTAGSTNVIIDLQEDKHNPTFYLVDLGLN